MIADDKIKNSNELEFAIFCVENEIWFYTEYKAVLARPNDIGKYRRKS